MDMMLVLPLVLLAVMMFFMWRGNKRNQERQQQMRQSMAPGVEVMTQAGIYGTIVDFDEANNVAVIESTPGTRIRVHSATIVNVVTPNVVVPDDASELDEFAVDRDATAADRTADGIVDPAAERDEAAADLGTDPVDRNEFDDETGRDERDGDAPKA